MTQIYVNRSGSNKNRLIPVLLVLLVILTIGVTFWLRARNQPAPPPPQEEVAVLVENTDATALPQATAAPATSLPNFSLAQIEAMVNEGELEKAREAAIERLSAIQNAAERAQTEQLLGDLNIRMVFSRAPMQEKVTHIVVPGNTLGGLAQKYGTTKELISISNGLQNNIIRVGKSLVILQGQFSAVVDKSSNEMELRLNDRFFKRYQVGTGTDSSTPVGDYVITLRLRHPVWYRPDGESFAYGHPENLLGTHYLKLNTPGIGLHGTWAPETIGSQSSAGCVRFQNEMIEELYKILPEGTNVQIVD